MTTMIACVSSCFGNLHCTEYLHDKNLLSFEITEISIHCCGWVVQPASHPWSSPPKSHLNRSLAGANITANSPSFINSCARSESLRSRSVVFVSRLSVLYVIFPRYVHSYAGLRLKNP